jgi:hypothetical protein
MQSGNQQELKAYRTATTINPAVEQLAFNNKNAEAMMPRKTLVLN